MPDLPIKAMPLKIRLDELRDGIVLRAVELVPVIYEQRIDTVLEDEAVAAAITPRDTRRLKQLRAKGHGGGAKRKAKRMMRGRDYWPHTHSRHPRDFRSNNPLVDIDVGAWIELGREAERYSSLGDAVGLATWAGPGSFWGGVGLGLAVDLVGAVKVMDAAAKRPEIKAVKDPQVEKQRAAYDDLYGEFFELAWGEQDRARRARRDAQKKAAREALEMGQRGMNGLRAALEDRAKRKSKTDDPAGTLATLAELRDAGVISEAEFAEKKAKLLNEI